MQYLQSLISILSDLYKKTLKFETSSTIKNTAQRSKVQESQNLEKQNCAQHQSSQDTKTSEGFELKRTRNGKFYTVETTTGLIFKKNDICEITNDSNTFYLYFLDCDNNSYVVMSDANGFMYSDNFEVIKNDENIYWRMYYDENKACVNYILFNINTRKCIKPNPQSIPILNSCDILQNYV